MQVTEKRPQVTPVALKSILFATDFSDSSLAALPHVGAIARRYKSKVYLAHVIVSENYPFVSPEVAAVRSQQMAQRAKQQLAELSGQLEGIPNEPVLAHGEAAEAVIKMIKEHNIDLVVVGTHGRRGFKRLLLGSVAEEVFRMSPCPALIVGPHLSQAIPQETALRNILYPTDLLKESFCALPYAVSLAVEHAATLTLLHVLPEASATHPGLETVTAEFREQMKRPIPVEVAPTCKTEALVELGDTVETILRVSRERRTDLIVLGVKEADPLASHLRGNLAYRIVMAAECPVLVVRDNPGREG